MNPFARPDPDQYRKRIGKGLDRAFGAASERELQLDGVRLVLFSDQHKGSRDGADDFQRCERAYNAALAHYLEGGHHLMILGDAEELWECSPEEIVGAPGRAGAYEETLQLEAEFHRRGRYDRLWGNHDDLWNSRRAVAKHLGRRFEDLRVLEALKLRVADGDVVLGTIFLAHGHQGTLESDRFRWISRLFVRHVWRPLQRKLNMASTSPSTDWALIGTHDAAMSDWARRHPERPVLVTGHTHRPVFGDSKPQPKYRRPPAEVERELESRRAAGAGRDELATLRAELEWARAEDRRLRAQPRRPDPSCAYFNTGCCSFGDGDVTGLELADGEIRLVRWPDPAGEPEPMVLARDDLRAVLRKAASAG